MANAATISSEGSLADHNERTLALTVTQTPLAHSGLSTQFYTSQRGGCMLRANSRWMLTRQQIPQRHLSLKIVVSAVPTW